MIVFKLVRFQPRRPFYGVVMIIHLDLDGVVVDFHRGFKQHTGRKIESFTSTSEFWVFAEQFPRLYADLPLTPDAMKLVGYVRSLECEFGVKVEYLTAIPSVRNMPYAEGDKKLWTEKKIPYRWKFKTGPHAVDKQKHAKPGDILIDDKERNIQQWNAAGGTGILHTSAVDTIKQLKRIFKG